MKITVIHGSPRRGNTYKAAQIFLDGVRERGDVTVQEFFLPQDMPHFCCGCANCVMKGEEKCPHAESMRPITASILESDGLLFTTPVYVLSASGGMKVFLDHLAYWYMNHRPRPEMFRKQAYVISTAAGAGMKKAAEAVAISLRYWGIRRVHRLGFHVMALSWDEIPEKRRLNYEQKLRQSGVRFAEALRGMLPPPTLFTRVFFKICLMMQKGNTYNAMEREYWKSNGWLDGKKPF